MDDPEIKAMNDIFVILNGIEDSECRSRILSWAIDRFGDDTIKKAPSTALKTITPNKEEQGSEEFKTFADLYNSALPETNGDKALVAGYWLQQCLGHDAFPSQSVNKELQNLGHALANVTDAFNQLKNKKPALAIQVKKSGKSQQARKQYKLTYAGIEMVKERITQNQG